MTLHTRLLRHCEGSLRTAAGIVTATVLSVIVRPPSFAATLHRPQARRPYRRDEMDRMLTSASVKRVSDGFERSILEAAASGDYTKFEAAFNAHGQAIQRAMDVEFHKGMVVPMPRTCVGCRTCQRVSRPRARTRRTRTVRVAAKATSTGDPDPEPERPRAPRSSAGGVS